MTVRVLPDPQPYFVISHDTNAFQFVPEEITVSVYDQLDFPYLNYTGTITLDVIRSIGGDELEWIPDAFNQGTFTNLGAGDTRAVYEFVEGDRGVVKFYVIDYTVESINVEINSIESGSDTDTEGWIKLVPAPWLLIQSTTPWDRTVSTLPTTTSITTIMNWGLNPATVDNASYYITDSEFQLVGGTTAYVDPVDQTPGNPGEPDIDCKERVQAHCCDRRFRRGLGDCRDAVRSEPGSLVQ